jgi:hypothetical protein
MQTVFRILGTISITLALGSLSACFDGPYYPAYPGYSHGAFGWFGSPAYAYQPYPRYAPPSPRYYSFNPGYHHGGSMKNMSGADITTITI